MARPKKSKRLFSIIRFTVWLTQPKSTRAAFVGLCYSINKPVSASVIEKTIRDNDGHLTRGAHNRRQASVAALDNTLRESGIGYEGDMEFSAEQAKGRDDHSDEPTINEKIVTPKAGSKKK